MLKKTCITLLACVTFSGVANASELSLWREPAPVLKQGKYQSIILDRGKLVKAIRGSNNDYLFTEKGAGVKPLVFIGTSMQLVEFLKNNETRGIESHIPELQTIYMGVSKYKPTAQFSGLFPLNDVFISAVENAQRFLPFGTIITDAAGIPSDIKDFYNKMHQLDEDKKAQGEALYVKFSYLPEDGMRVVGNKTVSFGRILQQLVKN